MWESHSIHFSTFVVNFSLKRRRVVGLSLRKMDLSKNNVSQLPAETIAGLTRGLNRFEICLQRDKQYARFHKNEALQTW